MAWFQRLALSEKSRIERNISRLDSLCSCVHDLGYFAIASNSGGYEVLQRLLEDSVVRGRDLVEKKLRSALIGENNQKVVMDAPTRFQSIMIEAEGLIKREISKEQRALRKLTGVAPQASRF